MSKYAQYKICVERHKNIHVLHSINKVLNKAKRGNLRAAFQKSKIWPQNSEINVYISVPKDGEFKPSFTELDVLSQGGKLEIDPIENELRTGNKGKPLSYSDCVKLVITTRVQPLVNLKFNFVKDKKIAHVKVGFEDDGAWAYVGTDNTTKDKGHTVNFGWIDGATMIHEFFHVLGLIHEHQNPNGKPIDWDENVVYKWAEDTQGWDKNTTYNNIIKHYSMNQINGTSFDPNSIMLYFFPGQLTKDKVGTHQNNIVSKMDYDWIIKQYPGGDLSKFTGPLKYGSEKSGTNITMILIGIAIIVIILFFFFFFREKV